MTVLVGVVEREGVELVVVVFEAFDPQAVITMVNRSTMNINTNRRSNWVNKAISSFSFLWFTSPALDRQDRNAIKDRTFFAVN